MSQRISSIYDYVNWDSLTDDPEIIITGNSSGSSISQEYVQKLFETVPNINKITLVDITYIADYAFSNIQSNRFEVILQMENSNSIRIDNYAFFNSYLSSMFIITDYVTQLGVGAFKDCRYLTSLVFSSLNTHISDIPAYLCENSGLTEICVMDEFGEVTKGCFTDSITTIGDNAFKNCTNMTRALTIGDNVTNIGNYAFYNTGITTFNVGSGITQGATMQGDKFNDANYSTERTITPPYNIYLTSKRQFRYKHFTVESDAAIGYLYRFEPDDMFKYCVHDSHIMIFKNGLLIPNTYYYVHSIVSTPIFECGIVFNVPLTTGDQIDIFYVTNDLHHLEVDYYDTIRRERYIKNGTILLNRKGNEYRVMGEQMYHGNTNRTNYIKMRSPLYGISSKHSTFVFLNGKKVRMDELEDITDTILAINTDYATTNPDDMNAVHLEVLNHLDTQDIIEHMYINDGLNHDDSVAQSQFADTDRPNIYKNTQRIDSFDLADLDSYAERTLLDEMLADLSSKSLNKLFYNYQQGTGPMTPYGELSEPDFAKPDEIIPVLIDEYYYEESNDYIWDIVEGEHSNTIFYIGQKDKIRVPKTWADEDVKALYGTTYNRNTFLKKIVIPEGVESIE